jgi:sulfur relay (sulfurtransferase) complex TusBCD TusD component (DsrE family)
MRKIKAMYFAEKEEKENAYQTGLFLQLEDGTFIAQNSTDPIVSFSEVTQVPPITVHQHPELLK